VTAGARPKSAGKSGIASSVERDLYRTAPPPSVERNSSIPRERIRSDELGTESDGQCRNRRGKSVDEIVDLRSERGRFIICPTTGETTAPRALVSDLSRLARGIDGSLVNRLRRAPRFATPCSDAMAVEIAAFPTPMTSGQFATNDRPCRVAQRLRNSSRNFCAVAAISFTKPKTSVHFAPRELILKDRPHPSTTSTAAFAPRRARATQVLHAPRRRRAHRVLRSSSIHTCDPEQVEKRRSS
jgi:hypothetical protein